MNTHFIKLNKSTMNTFDLKTLNSVEFLTVFQLKMVCKNLKIRGYSGKRKSIVQNMIITYLKNKQEKEIQETKGLFCYPEIIQTIYEYHNIDDVDYKRKNIIKNAKKEYERTKIIITKFANVPWRERNAELKKLKYRHWNDILNENYGLAILMRTDFNKMLKRDLKIWLQTLGYKPKGGLSKLRKNQLLNLVEKHVEELSSI